MNKKVNSKPGEFKSPFKHKPWKEKDPTESIVEAQYELHRNGLDWVTANFGIHLQVVQPGNGVIADLWPTTGRWMNRKSGRAVKSGHAGVVEMINRMNLTKE